MLELLEVRHAVRDESRSMNAKNSSSCVIARPDPRPRLPRLELDREFVSFVDRLPKEVIRSNEL
jgi:hypothetical protein